MRCGVLCFVFLCIGFARYADGLRSSSKGVCVTKHTVVKTRPRSVLVTISKWCGKRRCTARRTQQQKYSVTTNRLVCCSGYMYKAGTDSCEPVCSTGCFNGTCISPNVCSCAPPTYLDPTTKNKCLTPICDHPCINSQCNINNTCTCIKNFTTFNSTHCAPNCTEGYELDSNLNCTPKCENCTNGRCTAPDTCTCNPGFKYAGTCKPECNPPCSNGSCIAPNTCRCSEGYVVNGTGCISKCDDCANGQCVAPGVCECNKGYSKKNGTCQPVCKGCVNGHCIGPDICQCDDGFFKRNATVCLPSCNNCKDRGTCMTIVSKIKLITYLDYNMNCGRDGKSKCPQAVTKTRPEEVTKGEPGCCVGYEYSIDEDICVPLCRFGCVGGTCVAPDNCKCKLPDVLIRNKCITPACDPPCLNGNCTGPNTCTCNGGYQLKEDNFTCAAQCTDCENGKCVTPNVCVCNEGFTMINKKCKPVCKNKCTNGFCSAPEKCSCDKGYELKNGTCEPVCDVACVNAKCVAPKTCACLSGFEPKGASKEVCQPKCDSCVHGDCIGPNQCSCYKGYALIDKVCKPICDKTCVNATCEEPYVCKCFDGFEPTAVKEVCKPKCDSCINGDCEAPNKCVCHTGYSLIDKACIPVCEDKCVNAKCVGPNKCKCYAGFEPKYGNKAVCQPKCDSCVHGDCIGPNQCSCHEGYALIDKVCRPVCKNMCVNATCMEPNVCKCLDGFEPTGVKESCRPKCQSCIHGDCEAPNKCVCRSGYSLVDNDCKPVCEDKCVNAKCVGPEQCECFAGFEPKQGHEAVCKPKCDSCVNGECTAPNKCVCRTGYFLTGGVCRPMCIDECVNGNCTAPGKCTCNEGYTRNETNPSACYKACNDCGVGRCNSDGECICGVDSQHINGTCVSSAEIKAYGMESAKGLASLEMSWLVGSAVVLLLIVLVVVVIQRMWRRQTRYGQKTADNGNTLGSVIYTLPDTLIKNEAFIRKDDNDEEGNESDEEGTNESLMNSTNGIV